MLVLMLSNKLIKSFCSANIRYKLCGRNKGPYRSLVTINRAILVVADFHFFRIAYLDFFAYFSHRTSNIGHKFEKKMTSFNAILLLKIAYE